MSRISLSNLSLAVGAFKPEVCCVVGAFIIDINLLMSSASGMLGNILINASLIDLRQISSA
jgi:hypothetical protein